jgi:[ribosomal protein S18]-alanine N-acetyltransferase
VRLVRFRWWHIEAVEQLEADLFGAERWSAAMFWNELASGHDYVVALDDGDDDVAGYAGLALAPPEAWVQNLGVRRNRQRQGVGRRLLEWLLARAEQQGIRRIMLEVATDNAPAQRLYAAYGFEPVGRRRGYYQPSNTDALVMLRED